jgi:hypothetical protein
VTREENALRRHYEPPEFCLVRCDSDVGDIRSGFPTALLGVMREITGNGVGIAKFVQHLKTLKCPPGTIFFIPAAAWNYSTFGLLPNANFSTNSCNIGQG